MQKANINFILSLYQSLRRGLSDWIDYLHNYGIIVIHSFIWFARANEDESINHPAPSPPPGPRSTHDHFAMHCHPSPFIRLRVRFATSVIRKIFYVSQQPDNWQLNRWLSDKNTLSKDWMKINVQFRASVGLHLCVIFKCVRWAVCGVRYTDCGQELPFAINASRVTTIQKFPWNKNVREGLLVDLLEWYCRSIVNGKREIGF